MHVHWKVTAKVLRIHMRVQLHAEGGYPYPYPHP